MGAHGHYKGHRACLRTLLKYFTLVKYLNILSISFTPDYAIFSLLILYGISASFKLVSDNPLIGELLVLLLLLNIHMSYKRAWSIMSVFAVN